MVMITEQMVENAEIKMGIKSYSNTYLEAFTIGDDSKVLIKASSPNAIHDIDVASTMKYFFDARGVNNDIDGREVTIKTTDFLYFFSKI